MPAKVFKWNTQDNTQENWNTQDNNIYLGGTGAVKCNTHLHSAFYTLISFPSIDLVRDTELYQVWLQVSAS